MKKSNTINSLGMFDFIKGIGLVLIIFWHTFDMYGLIGKDNGIISLILFSLMCILYNIMMPAFFLMSGYYFSKKKFGSRFNKQIKKMFMPYVYVALISIVLNLIVHYFFFRYLAGAVAETKKVAVSFLLVLSKNVTIADTVIYCCGPIWFVIALIVGYVMLQVIVHYVPEKYVPFGVLLSVVIGWILGEYFWIPFCIAQGLIATGFIYIGYIIKKRKLLDREFNIVDCVICLCALGVSVCSLIYTNKIDSMAEGIWSLGIISIFIDGILCYYVISYALRLNFRRLEIKGAISKIGRYSVIVLAVHSIEYIVIPWYLFAEKWQDHKLIGAIIHYVIRLALVIVVSELVVKIKMYLIKNKIHKSTSVVG